MKNASLLLLLGALITSCIGHEDKFVRSLTVKFPADLVFLNGKVITADSGFSIKQAVAIREGRFVAVGSDYEMRPWTSHRTRVINLRRHTVIPGLIDSHLHATMGGKGWDSELHWDFTRSLADGLKQIAAAAREKPPGSWIVVGGGWVATQFPERRLPSRAELDAVAPKHPVYVQYLRQAAILNSIALASVGVHRQTTDPAGGKFERDAITGEPTGLLLGVSGWEYAYNKIPRPTLDRTRQSFRNGFRELNRLGLTTAADIHGDGVTFAHRRLLADMAGTGELTVRLSFYIVPDDLGDEHEQLRLGEEVKQLAQNDMFRFGGFAATFGTGGAEAPANPKGLTLEPNPWERFRKLVRFAASRGYNLHLHSRQNSTVSQLLDVIEDVKRELPSSRQRIAFAQLEDASPETVARIRKLGGGIAAFTGKRNMDLSAGEKTPNIVPLRRMIDAGVQLGAGTGGFSSGNYSPMLSLWGLISGKTVAGTQVSDRAQTITREEALRIHTLGSAWFSLDEDRKGSIEVGKLADLVVLNADYLTVPEDQIRALESVLTVVGGRIVYAVAPFAHLASP